MKKPLFNQEKYLDAFIKTAQYLASLNNPRIVHEWFTHPHKYNIGDLVLAQFIYLQNLLHDLAGC